MAKKKKKRKQHRFFWFMVKLQIVLMVFVLAGLGYYYFGGYAVEVQDLKKEAVQLVSDSTNDTFVPAHTCSVYDINGDLISETNGDKDAVYVKYEDIPADFVTAMISIEDKKFYQHSGVDYRAILRAVKAALEKGEASQGGSTITMQLAKLVYLDSSRTWERKVEQIFAAIELEKRYSKNKIMEFYLNNIYFANGYYGIEAACKGYFNCELSELDLSQIAFLCAIPNSPTYYDPVDNIDHTLKRRNLILKNMYEDGKITLDAYNSSVIEEITLNRPQEDDTHRNNYVDTYAYYCATRALMQNEGFVFQYYFDTDEEEQLYDEKYDDMYAECQKKIYSGGYKIYTSIDLAKQSELQSAVDETLSTFQETGDDGVYSLQGSAVSINNDTGLVTAIVGGRTQDFTTYTLNRAYQSYRQPGSCIKPVIDYTPAFERGYTPDSIVCDEPIENGPQNASKTYKGDVTIRYAVEQSLNTVAWKLYEEITPQAGLQYLKNMNFSQIKQDDYTAATSIGGFTIGMSTLEMASAYATLENDGVYREPTCVTSILDSEDKEVYVLEQKETVIYKETASRMMTDVLKSVMTDGLGRKMQLDNMISAGKTGTTNDNKDGWFCGYTRYYTTAVWVGYDIPQEVPGLAGGSYPGQIWQTYMNKIHEGKASMDFLPYAQLSGDFQSQDSGDTGDEAGADDNAGQQDDGQNTDENAAVTDPNAGASQDAGQTPEGQTTTGTGNQGTTDAGQTGGTTGNNTGTTNDSQNTGGTGQTGGTNDNSQGAGNQGTTDAGQTGGTTGDNAGVGGTGQDSQGGGQTTGTDGSQSNGTGQ